MLHPILLNCMAASNTFKRFAINFGYYTKGITKAVKCDNTHWARKLCKFWHQIGCRDFNLDAIQIWRIWLFYYPAVWYISLYLKRVFLLRTVSLGLIYTTLTKNTPGILAWQITPYYRVWSHSDWPKVQISRIGCREMSPRHCTMYSTLYSFSLKLCIGTIDLKT